MRRPLLRSRRLPPRAACLTGCAAAVLLLGAVGGCATGTYEAGVFRDRRVAFRTGALPDAWSRVRVQGGQLAFHHDRGGTISASGDCPGDDAPLDVLANHLLVGFESRREVGRDRVRLDGRDALRTGVLAALDGVPVHLDLVVLRKDACTFDLQLLASPEDYDARRADFDAFVSGFGKVSAP